MSEALTPLLFPLWCVVVTGATSGIGKAYATEVTLQITVIIHLFLILMSPDLLTAKQL